MTATVDRMRAVNGHLNAVVDDLGDEAIAHARNLDVVLKTSGPVGPLHGVPVTIKENIDQKGRATPNGVRAFADVIAPDDAPIVRNLTRDGAIVIGRTNTPEFSFRATTTNDLHGRTFNPWNDWASSGGSSGGASAAVMSGMGPSLTATTLAARCAFRRRPRAQSRSNRGSDAHLPTIPRKRQSAACSRN